MAERWTALTLVLFALLVVAWFVLSGVAGVVVLAVAAAYVLVPLHRWFLRRGVPAYWGAIAASLTGAVAAVLVSLPFGFVLYARRDVVRAVVDSLAVSVSVVVGGRTITFDPAAFVESLAPQLSSLAVFLGRQLSVLSAKLIVFAFVVFALLYYHAQLRALAFEPVPSEYHDIIETVHRRVRGVLFGHYVLAFVGGTVTYVLGLGVFFVLGYQIPFALALAAAVMWILPFISAGPLVLTLTAYHALLGEHVMAVSVGVLGAVFLVAVPNVLVYRIRRRLGDTQRLSEAVYLVGFVGGGLSFGVVGLVAGPLALAALSSLAELLAVSSPQPATPDG